jgi:glycosyltransferase involved in cell wall biosynthesis
MLTSGAWRRPACMMKAVDKRQSISVHYVGFLTGHFGLAQSARYGISALTAAGVLVKGHDLTPVLPVPRGSYTVPTLPNGAVAPSVTIIGTNPPELSGALLGLPKNVKDTYRIGCWYWETPVIPEEWCNSFALLNEIWASTTFVADAIRAKATVPVAVIPFTVKIPSLEPDRSWLMKLVPGLAAEEFVFLFQFCALSVPFRKNPEGTIRAFVTAFRPNEAVHLVVKIQNSGAEPELMLRLKALAKGFRVSFLEVTLDSTDRFRLLASTDCFVSLHRAEGLGLSIAEAMTYRRPVIVTGWSGNLDFTDTETAALVDYDLFLTDQAYGPYPAGTTWAEPRIIDAARQMRRMLDDHIWRDEIAAAGQRRISECFSAEKVGKIMRARLERITTVHRAGARYNHSEPRSNFSLIDLILNVITDPGFYFSRLLRIPQLLFTLGPRKFLFRLHLALMHRISHIKRTGKS